MNLQIGLVARCFWAIFASLNLMKIHNPVSFPRYDFKFQRVDRGYPKAIGINWPGVTEKIDAAVSLRNGTILLFNGNRSFSFHPPLCKDKTAFFDVSSDFR